MSKLLIFSLSAFIGLAAFNPATARTMDKQRTACERDSHKFCAAEEPNAIAVEKCLRAHMNELSSACKRQFKAKRR
ncbi:hypothetical protein HUN39_16630 [Methylocystis sp. FS]|uniref:hypothetical protein n=1 Tax=Methylocystis silviterrae TaxID=2743612 RepID=UPI0015827DEE|nr:hypothetical protein [Methylocystis silviterrae]NUJ81619.1 hypothetical protein [Methylocystis silviterrae]